MPNDPCICGNRIKKRPRFRKLRYPHKCPHGRPCAGGIAGPGTHANHPVIGGQCFCPDCFIYVRGEYPLAAEYHGRVGFRYEIARAYGLHTGVDLAFGPDVTAIYIQFGSAWAGP